MCVSVSVREYIYIYIWLLILDGFLDGARLLAQRYEESFRDLL